MKMYIESSVGGAAIGPLSIRCPGCRQIGTFETVGSDIGFNSKGTHISTGQKRCPNPSCKLHIFVALHNNRLAALYPAERIDFDSANVPSAIIASLEEAITCHANQCFIAAAIMVRKTLELLCNAQNATGSNLKERLKALGSSVVLPPDLLTGLDDLRLLGNDAAHVESQAYIQVGREELEVAIEFTKEVLKAIYQYTTLLTRLRGLRKQ